MTRTVSANRPDPSTTVAEFADELFRHARRLLAARYPRLSFADADDVADSLVEVFYRSPESVMAGYPNALAYASATVSSRLEDWRRRERAQRGEGARLAEDADGQKQVKRKSTPITDLDLDRGLGGADEEATTVRRLYCEQLLASLDARTAALVRAVDMDGLTVSEACVTLGLSRSYASRMRTAALRRLADEAGGALAC